MFDPVTLGMISGGVGATLGFVQRAMTMGHEFKLKLLDLKKGESEINLREADFQDKLAERAYERQKGAKWIVRWLVFSTMFAVVFATWINGFFDVSSFIEIEQTAGWFKKLFGASHTASKIVEIKGFFLSKEVQAIAAVVSHFYFGARVGGRKL